MFLNFNFKLNKMKKLDYEENKQKLRTLIRWLFRIAASKLKKKITESRETRLTEIIFLTHFGQF